MQQDVVKDELFAAASGPRTDFSFGQKTAEVFDDMLDRSIPQYRELQRMIGEIAAEYAQPGTRIYDLGCSTGITLETLRRHVADRTVSLHGLDYSDAMLQRCTDRVAGWAPEDAATVQLTRHDLNGGAPVQNASVVVLNLTLQFVRPMLRDQIVRDIHEGLLAQGCLILVEKVVGEHSLLNRQFIRWYYDMKKRNGYSDLEIAKKREALENVLIPYRMQENMDLLRAQGFQTLDVFFRWYNFCGILAVKNA